MRPCSPNFGKPSQCLKAWSLEACACPDTCTHSCLTFRIAFRRTSKSKVGKNILGEKQPAFCSSSCSSLLSPQSPKTLQVTLGVSGLLVAGYLCVLPDSAAFARWWRKHFQLLSAGSFIKAASEPLIWLLRTRKAFGWLGVFFTKLSESWWQYFKTEVDSPRYIRSWWTAPVSKGQLLFFNSSNYFVCVLRELETIITTYIKCLPCARCFIYITLCNSWPEKAPCCFLG